MRFTFGRFLVAALIYLGFCAPAFAWDSTGHRLIASIAYQQLTPAAKKAVDNLTQVLFTQRNPKARFLKAAVWPDQLRAQGINDYNQWHYINLPWVIGPIVPPKIAEQNVVWAILNSERELQGSTSSPLQQAKSLAFLEHFIGDVHQPLHCLTRYSREFPHGDLGGNLFPIQSPWANNLHRYWDEGVGLFHQPGERYPLRAQAVQALAYQIRQQYPSDSVRIELAQKDPWQWAQASYALAKNSAYTLKPYSRPSAEYVRLNQAIVAKQIALSGYRLAAVLNELYK